MWSAVAGLAMGAIQAKKQEREADAQRKLQSELARVSPYTGIAPNMGAIKEADPMGSMMQGAMMGLQFDAQNPGKKPGKDRGVYGDMGGASGGEATNRLMTQEQLP